MLLQAIVACAPQCGVEAGTACATSTSVPDEPEPVDTAVELGDILVFAKVEDCGGDEWNYLFDLSELPLDAELALTGTLADGERADELHALGLAPTDHWQASATLFVVD